MIWKGRKWEVDIAVTEWLQMEIEGEIKIEVERTKDTELFEVWCKGKETKGKI